jgi:hypothetical protein
VDIEKYNADWLAAWSAKDTDRLLTFYGPGIIYKDARVPLGISGHQALKAYLDALFGATPPMHYIPDATWPIPGGYCGRWNCEFELADGSKRNLRGFDLVLMDGDQITYNEVYTHELPA